jgi:hypothetical protein
LGKIALREGEDEVFLLRRDLADFGICEYLLPLLLSYFSEGHGLQFLLQMELACNLFQCASSKI